MTMEANILLAKCPNAHLMYGIRVEKRENDWVRTWAFKISEKSAIKEGFDKTNIRGTFQEVDEYPGCPYCGCHDIVVCGKCGKISCFPERVDEAVCEWCGNKSKVSIVDTLSASGGQF